jgi:hypothetical protein
VTGRARGSATKTELELDPGNSEPFRATQPAPAARRTGSNSRVARFARRGRSTSIVSLF